MGGNSRYQSPEILRCLENITYPNLADRLFLRYLTSPETQAKWVSGTAYFPSISATDVSDREASDPVWVTGYELLEIGKGEPNLVAHGSVRGAIRDAFFTILDAEDEAAISAVLEGLQEQVDELVAESQ